MEIFKPQPLYSNTPVLYTRLTELLQTPVPAVPSLVYGRVSSLNNVLDCESS